MKKLLLAGLGAFLIALAGAALAAPQGPRITFKELQYNAGSVPEGTTVSHIFEMRNTGDAPLVIDRVAPS